MECHGGAGYVEEWPIARFYRQAPLNGIWEGSGNVICLDVLRALSRAPSVAEVFLNEVARAKGANVRLDAAMAELETQMASADESSARQLTEQMALVLQASLLVQHAPPFVADAFCATRLGDTRAQTYGAGTAKAEIDAILSRAYPQ